MVLVMEHVVVVIKNRKLRCEKLANFRLSTAIMMAEEQRPEKFLIQHYMAFMALPHAGCVRIEKTSSRSTFDMAKARSIPKPLAVSRMTHQSRADSSFAAAVH